jgi:hypothetical protein
MSGGIPAIQGFVYQATVILEVLLRHIREHDDARVRPEGADDLELVWSLQGVSRREYIQIKKPRETGQGRLTQEPWSLTATAQELLLDAVKHLQGNTHTQRWILGDAVDPDVQALVDAGVQAPTQTLSALLRAVHLLAQEESRVAEQFSSKQRRSLGQWHFVPPSGSEPDDALERMMTEFGQTVSRFGLTDQQLDRYRAIARAGYQELPSILARIHVQSTFGRENEVRARVCRELTRRYPVSLARVEDTIFGNMRAFIDDVSTCTGRWIGQDEIDGLVLRVWPEMIPLREPPLLPTPHVEREDLVARVVGLLPVPALEIIGVAGSGKTSLARSVYDHVKSFPIHVSYVEAGRDRSLREILTAAAFHLRQQGITTLWDALTQESTTEEQRIRTAAAALSGITDRVLVLVDLVEGDCNAELARLLAEFIRSGPPEQFTLAIFGQESALRDLTPLQREQANIPPAIEQIGFRFDEFEALVGHFHPNVDRQRLRHLFQRLTAGRVAGLFARLAYDLARLPSVEDMERIADGPVHEVVPRAVRERFNRLAHILRPAAEKLTCFLLPFRLADAKQIFPRDRIEAAARDLLELGLLQHHDADRLEMHETVRRTLQEEMPPEERQSVHRCLAAWYQIRGQLLAEIHHLDMAGRRGGAVRKAREAFLAGRHMDALMPYVAEHRAIAPGKLASWLMKETLPERLYLIPALLRIVGDAATAEALFAGLQRRTDRFDADFRWAWIMVESILSCDPARLSDLVRFGLQMPSGPGGRPYERLERVAQGIRHVEARVDQGLLDLFDQLEDEGKRTLLDILLLAPRQEVLENVLPFVDNFDPDSAGQRRRVAGPSTHIHLPLRNRAEIVEFLAAMPLPETSAMLVARSPLLGRLAEMVWAEREALRSVCAELLDAGNQAPPVLENALRVLLVLGDERVLHLSERYRDTRSRFGTLSVFVPAMVSLKVDPAAYKDRLLDPQRDFDRRMGDFTTLFAISDDLSGLLQELRAADPANARTWDCMFLMNAALRPFEGAIPLIEQALNDCTSEEQAGLLAPIMMKLGELPGENSTEMLVRALSSPWPVVRLFACTGLQTRRSKRACGALQAMCQREADPRLGQSGMVALLSSGPDAKNDLTQLWSRFPEAEVWRHVLAGRLRIAAEAPSLVATAIDSAKHWQLRRAAILSASRLPFDLALTKIVDPVLQERSPFELDRNPSLLGHNLLCGILESSLLHVRPDLQPFLQQLGLFGFVETVYEVQVTESLFPEGAPSAADAIKWLKQRLLHHGGPERPEALDRVLDDLHLPILQAAVLRGLRLTGRFDRIEGVIRSAETEWLVMRAATEWSKGRVITGDMVAQLHRLIGESRFADRPSVQNLIHSVASRTGVARQGAGHPPRNSAATPVTPLGAAEVMAALASGQLPGRAPFVVSCSDASEFGRLVELLDPARDYTSSSETVEPNIAFIKGGVTIGGSQVRHRDNHAGTRAALRPAIAAANQAGIPILWHDKMLSDSKYLASFLEHLGALNDSGRFYQELARNGDRILPRLGDSVPVSPVKAYIDERIIPYLSRYAHAGTDAFLEVLADLARCVDGPAIDPVIEVLFNRWLRRFDLKSTEPQHEENFRLWRAFNSLSGHPRFQRVPNYDLRLMQIAHLPMSWFRKPEIVRLICNSPRSYSSLEMMLLKAAPFEHFHEDDIDRLDAAADALFSRVTEG